MVEKRSKSAHKARNRLNGPSVSPKKKKKPVKSRKAIIEGMDRICSIKTKERARGTCEVCGNAGTQTHHYFSKKVHGSVRWDMRNLIYLCYACHIIKIHMNADSEHAREVLVGRLGQDEFDSLEESAHKTVKHTIKDLEELYEAIK